MVVKRTAILLSAVVVIVLVVGGEPSLTAEDDGIPRTPSGRPDLSGTYDAATLTPLERPVELGEKAFLTLEEARELAEGERAFADRANRQTEADREAPPEGGAAVVGFEEDPDGGNRFGAGNVGGYNWFWVDRGSEAFAIDGLFPTSIVTDPPNGRVPALTPEALAERRERIAWRRPNDGTAWWLEMDGPGPYDGPESLGIAERCLLGFTGAAPTFPSLYNNFKRIVQTEDHVMILIEMVHDARIVRLGSEHPPADQRSWLGDSIGWWEGDTLVVETTNFRPDSLLRGGSENTRVVERFTKQVGGDVLYQFTIEDPTVWTAPWTGEYLWRASDERVYEYACHEGNYAMQGILRGARLLEAEARGELTSTAEGEDD
ncbi:MAG TPA: hypothetical protein VMV46_02240 [Thermoanaerobaculia bacterium]|nr:hypothetical protein [Thermoanaerobaculia bacterium]